MSVLYYWFYRSYLRGEIFYIPDKYHYKLTAERYPWMETKTIVWSICRGLDRAIFNKIRWRKGDILSLHIIPGIDNPGNQDILSMHIEQNGSATSWSRMLNDLISRGVQDILILCPDNLKGLEKSLESTLSTAYEKYAYFTDYKYITLYPCQRNKDDAQGC